VEDVHREDIEIGEAVIEMYGDDVDLAITPVPCTPYDCPHCRIDGCPNRSREFVMDLEWDNDTMSRRHRDVPVEGEDAS
jgi:hypothetical protein